jgi:hypothetical protein
MHGVSGPSIITTAATLTARTQSDGSGLVYMGGGTGTGRAPVAARIARAEGAQLPGLEVPGGAWKLHCSAAA